LNSSSTKKGRGPKARPLSENINPGMAYTRPGEIEAKNLEALSQDFQTLCERATVKEPSDPAYLPSETLVFLIRGARRRNDGDMMSALLPHLLKRCECILNSKIQEWCVPNPEEFREEILAQFAMLFAEDSTSKDKHKLDFYETRFNLAFRAFRIDNLRKELKRAKHTDQLVEENELDEEDEKSQQEIPLTQATQIIDLLQEEIKKAIQLLSPMERRVLIFRFHFGYQLESTNSDKLTVSKLCNISGRTAQNHILRAVKKLSRFKGV